MEVYETLPIVPLRDVVVFPHMMMPFVIGRPSSTRALDHALGKDKRIFLAAQHDASIDDPRPDDIYTMGCVANVVQHLRLPDGNVKVLVEGIDRARAVEWKEDKGFYRVVVKVLQKQKEAGGDVESTMGRVVSLFEQYVKLSNNLQYDAMVAAVRVDDPGKLADTISAHLVVGVDEKQNLLEIISPLERLNRIAGILEIEVDKLQVDRRIQSRVKKQMEKAQKEYYLNEKMKAIQKELGRKDDKGNEIDDLKKKIEQSRMPKDVEEKALQELKRLEAMPPMSAEATVSRNYLDWLIAVPWHKKTRENRDLKHAEQVLNEDHYGLDKIKDRILEFLAVRSLVKKPKATDPDASRALPASARPRSAKSIARAMNRKFVRLSLGGVRDEAEIRGHRRTYIGAFPGQIIQMMKKAGTQNPVFLLDEIDKMSMDFRGDPSAALLEVLDPEQNDTFLDHYLDVEYDLSHVMFICTANVLHTIPQALRDRMEVMQLAGYTEQEKVEIAKRFLVPKAVEGAGLTAENIIIKEDAIQTLIQRYTREAGVRNLEREISSICRKVARKVVRRGQVRSSRRSAASKVTTYLGVPRFRPSLAEEHDEVGIATGLAWTEVGGELLVTEVTLMPGKGKLTLTGKLGDVMQESAQAALSYVRSRPRRSSASAEDFHSKLDIHVHVPEGAIPKDGPSAGITMATRWSRRSPRLPVRRDVAMTGRDHAARQGAADRRREGEDAGRAPRRREDHHPAARQREGPGRHPEERARRDRHAPRVADGRSAEDRAGRPAADPAAGRGGGGGRRHGRVAHALMVGPPEGGPDEGGRLAGGLRTGLQATDARRPPRRPTDEHIRRVRHQRRGRRRISRGPAARGGDGRPVERRQVEPDQRARAPAAGADERGGRQDTAGQLLSGAPGIGTGFVSRGSARVRLCAGRRRLGEEFTRLTDAYFARDVRRACCSWTRAIPGSSRTSRPGHWLATRQCPRHVVGTKVDKLTRAERMRHARTFDSLFEPRCSLVSAHTGEGLDELWKIDRKPAKSNGGVATHAAGPRRPRRASRHARPRPPRRRLRRPPRPERRHRAADACADDLALGDEGNEHRRAHQDRQGPRHRRRHRHAQAGTHL